MSIRRWIPRRDRSRRRPTDRESVARTPYLGAPCNGSRLRECSEAAENERRTEDRCLNRIGVASSGCGNQVAATIPTSDIGSLPRNIQPLRRACTGPMRRWRIAPTDLSTAPWSSRFRPQPSGWSRTPARARASSAGRRPSRSSPRAHRWRARRWSAATTDPRRPLPQTYAVHAFGQVANRGQRAGSSTVWPFVGSLGTRRCALGVAPKYVCWPSAEDVTYRVGTNR